MKKFLLALLTVSLSLTASAENTPDESTESGSYRVTEDKLNEVIDQLKSIEGYVFISKGERRELSTVFQKAPDILGDDENEIKSHDWEIANSSIAELQNNEGTVLGVNYGQTSLTVTDDKGVVHYFVIFVCPTMTVVSPEGAIYTHQKVYGQRAKVSFTHSNDYLINCVMMNFQGEVKDITDKVARESNDESGDTDGYYESEELVKDDMIFTVSMKNNPNSANNTEVVDNSGVRIQVQNKKVTFNDGDKGKIVPNQTRIVIYGNDKKNTKVYDGPVGEDKTIDFISEGIFYVYIEGIEGHYKIITNASK